MRRIEKPWGYELIWVEADAFVGKLLVLRAGCRLSLQYHKVKDEGILVQSGRVELEWGPEPDQLECRVLEEGDAIHLRPGTVHRLSGLEDSVLVEVSTPELDDVVRISDDYGRAKSGG